MCFYLMITDCNLYSQTYVFRIKELIYKWLQMEKRITCMLFYLVHINAKIDSSWFIRYQDIKNMFDLSFICQETTGFLSLSHHFGFLHLRILTGSIAV